MNSNINTTSKEEQTELKNPIEESILFLICNQCNNLKSKDEILTCAEITCQKNFCLSCMKNENQTENNKLWYCPSCKEAKNKLILASSNKKSNGELLGKKLKGDAQLISWLTEKNHEETIQNEIKKTKSKKKEKLIANAKECEHFYSRNYNNEAQKVTLRIGCLNCKRKIFHYNEIVHFNCNENFILYLKYLFSISRGIMEYSSKFKANKNEFEFIYKKYVRKQKNIEFNCYKDFCKLCLLKLINLPDFIQKIKTILIESNLKTVEVNELDCATKNIFKIKSNDTEIKEKKLKEKRQSIVLNKKLFISEVKNIENFKRYDNLTKQSYTTSGEFILNFPAGYEKNENKNTNHIININNIYINNFKNNNNNINNENKPNIKIENMASTNIIINNNSVENKRSEEGNNNDINKNISLNENNNNTNLNPKMFLYNQSLFQLNHFEIIKFCTKLIYEISDLKNFILNFKPKINDKKYRSKILFTIELSKNNAKSFISNLIEYITINIDLLRNFYLKEINGISEEDRKEVSYLITDNYNSFCLINYIGVKYIRILERVMEDISILPFN